MLTDRAPLRQWKIIAASLVLLVAAVGAGLLPEGRKSPPDDIFAELRNASAAPTHLSQRTAPRVKYRDEVSDYQQACRLAGVPVPEGSIASDPGWIRRAELNSETPRYFFRSDWNDSDLWTYRDAASGGFCVMLLRRRPDRDKEYAGTICTDALQTKACFFDNIVYAGDGTRRISWEEFRHVAFSELVHPKDGEDACNLCHLGNNPFLVHPATMLGQVVTSMYAAAVPKTQAFQFVGLERQPSPWVNYRPIDPPAGAPGCFGCHGIPKVTAQHRFCASVLELAANRTMPPGHWPSRRPAHMAWVWPDERGCFAGQHAALQAYYPSLVKLKAVCTGLPERTCPDPSF